MTVVRDLPPGIEPWGEALAALTPALATALLPMVHALDDLIGRRHSTAGDEGPPDGYDGLAARGVPERLLMSEWLLADELPLEFLRRAATGELLYLAQARRRPLRAGRVVALVDNGPDQLGAPRLAQLAALVVLHRRARASGTELAVGVLGRDPETWIEGDVAGVLRAWRSDRVHRAATAADVAARDAALRPGDEAWVLAGPDVAEALRRPRVACIRARTWDGTGTATLHVDLGEDTVELVMPDTALGIRALRGAAFRSDPPAVARSGPLRFPTFGSEARRLLARGDDATELLAVAVPSSRAERSPRVHRHRFPARVVAAAYLGKRLVALLAADDGTLRVRVVGKQIAWLDDIAVPFAAAGVTEELLAAVMETSLPEVHLLSTSLLVRLDDRWLALEGESATDTGYVAVSPGEHLDRPLRVSATGTGLRVNDWDSVAGTTGDERVVAGARQWYAISDDGVSWRPASLRGQRTSPIVVGAGDEVIALVTDTQGEPLLVTRSAAGLVLRAVGAGGAHTLTAWSGHDGRPAIHPTRPLIAVQRSPELVEVGDLLSGATLQLVRAET